MKKVTNGIFVFNIMNTWTADNDNTRLQKFQKTDIQLVGLGIKRDETAGTSFIAAVVEELGIMVVIILLQKNKNVYIKS